MTDKNSKRKTNDQLTPIRTSIRKEDDKREGEQQGTQGGKQDDMESLFGAPPLIPGDDADAYSNLLAGVTSTLKPTEIISKFLSRKFTDGMWMLRRLQLVQTTLLTTMGGGNALNLSLANGDQARAVAVALTDNIELFERLDRQIAGREHELRETYRMAERHKVNLDTTFKRAAEQVEDVEFSEIDDRGGDVQGGADNGEADE